MEKGKKKTLPRIVTPSVKILETTPEKSVIRVIGIPYNGPEYLEGKDLHGERFTKDTDFGRDKDGNIVVNRIFAYYDHALNSAIGKEKIGFSKFYQETDEGQVWDIEVMRAYRYHDMLLALAEKNLLGASSQPVQTSVEIDWETGDIKRWHTAEISLTPTPANPNADMVEIFKSFDYEIKDAISDTLETDETVSDIDELFETADNEDEENEEITVIPEQLESLSQAVADLQTTIDGLKSDIQTLSNSVDVKIKTVIEHNVKIQDSIVRFAANVAKRLKIEVLKTAEDRNRMTEEELEAEDELEHTPPVKNSYIPDNAPGRRVK